MDLFICDVEIYIQAKKQPCATFTRNIVQPLL